MMKNNYDVVRGIVHVHSHFSRDGLCSTADLAGFAMERGLQFVALTDHAEDLSPADTDALRLECEQHSDESFVMIPGLEFECDEELHILGLGVASHIESVDPIAVARQIGIMGGLAILAHPARNGYRCPRGLWGVLDGIEIWNARYDGRFVPPLAGLRLLQETRDANPAVLGFGGADIHDLEGAPGVTLELRVNGLDAVSAGMVLQALRVGNFLIRGNYVGLDAHPAPGVAARASLWAFRKSYEISKSIRDIAFGNRLRGW